MSVGVRADMCRPGVVTAYLNTLQKSMLHSRVSMSLEWYLSWRGSWWDEGECNETAKEKVLL